MTPKILYDVQDVIAALYNSQTEKLLGNLIWARKVGDRELGASEIAERFIEFCGGDVPEILNEWEYRWAMFQSTLTETKEE